jgi:hypothetical protein
VEGFGCGFLAVIVEAEEEEELTLLDTGFINHSFSIFNFFNFSSSFFIISYPFFLFSENISDLLLESLNQIKLNKKKTKERRDSIISFNLGEQSLSERELYFPFKKINK